MHSVQIHNSAQTPIHGTFYKIFIVLSKDRIPQIEQKIANLSKKDTIIYIQQEFEKARKWYIDRLDRKW